MQNVYDTLVQKGLMFILPEECKGELVSGNVLKKTAVFICLYYGESWERYAVYIRNIPKEIQVYVCSASPALLSRAAEPAGEMGNVILVSKENRGRDISALLVTFGKMMLQYEYICFIHDKRASFHYLEEDVAFWIRNMWDNTLGSTGYIYEVLGLLQRDDIGLLVPPEPLGEHFNDWYTNSWKKNYENTVSLASELDLHADISRDKTPVAIGSVFWAKSDALKKLLQREWKYNDFPKEPLPLDGTFNHAVERILPFVAQDAGYDTGVISGSAYASDMLLRLKESMTNTYEFLRRRMFISYEHQLRGYDELKSMVERYFHEYNRVFIYGAGAWGTEFLSNLRFWGYCPDGFIVSDGHRVCDMVEGISVYELREISAGGECGIFIAVNYDLQEEVEEKLVEKGFRNYYKLAVF